MSRDTSRDGGPFRRTAVWIWFTLQGSQAYSADWLTLPRDPMSIGWASEEPTFTLENLGRLGLNEKPQVNNEYRFLTGFRVPVVGSRVDTPSGRPTLVHVDESLHNVHALGANDGSVMRNVLSTTI